MVGIDFNSSVSFGQYAFTESLKGMANAHWTDCFLTTNGFSSQKTIRQMCSPISRQLSSKDFFLFRSIPVHGFRSDNVSAEPSRHRDLSESDATKALPLRYPRKCFTQYPGKRKRASQLENICRLRSNLDKQSSKALCQRRLRYSVKTHRLCSGFDDHRFMPVTVSMGKISPTQSRSQGAHANGAEGFYTLFYPHYRPRLYTFTQNLSTFVTRAKSNLDYHRLYYRKVDKTTGLRCDQTIRLAGFYTSQDYPAALRRIGYFDIDTNKKLVFLTNNFSLPALAIAQLYKCRWRIEIFFKWLKQYLRIKTFFGVTENAVKTQIWIAISVYVLVAIVKKELQIELSLSEILQILSIMLFEQVPMEQVLRKNTLQNQNIGFHNQLLLFDL